jgi:hypothetical protein
MALLKSPFCPRPVARQIVTDRHPSRRLAWKAGLEHFSAELNREGIPKRLGF